MSTGECQVTMGLNGNEANSSERRSRWIRSYRFVLWCLKPETEKYKNTNPIAYCSTESRRGHKTEWIHYEYRLYIEWYREGCKPSPQIIMIIIAATWTTGWTNEQNNIDKVKAHCEIRLTTFSVAWGKVKTKNDCAEKKNDPMRSQQIGQIRNNPSQLFVNISR